MHVPGHWHLSTEISILNPSLQCAKPCGKSSNEDEEIEDEGIDIEDEAE
jgi:hypothetical protein